MDSTRISTYDLTKLLIDWMQIPTKRESRNYLSTHLVLLSDDAEAILTQLAQFQTDDGTRLIVEEYCLLLHRCLEAGIIRAYAEKTHLPGSPDFVTNLPFVLDHFLGLMTWAEARQFLEQHPELLSEETDILLQEWVESEEDVEIQAFLNRTRTLLHRCQEIGIAPAFDEQLADLNSELSSELTAILPKLDQPPQGPQELPQYIELCQHALTLFDKNDNPQLWALLQNNLGVGYSRNPQGNRKDNLEQAIFHCQQALEIYTRQDFSEGWAMAQHNLANAFLFRITGQRAENLEQAIIHYNQALQVRTYQDFPEDWAMTQNNLGEAYRERLIGKRAANLEQAISHYKQALKIRTREIFPAEWAQTQSNLGNAYRERIVGKRIDNLERALSCCQQALQVYTRQDFPESWATLQHNLTNIFLFRIAGQRVDNLEQALSCCQQAMEVYTRKDYPAYWASSQQDLANVYSQRIVGERAANLEKAIYHYNQALEIKTERAFPTSWALIQHNLATVYQSRILGNRAENLEQALFHCKQALKIYTRQSFPEDWAMVQGTLGNIFLFRIAGEQRNNLERAIFHNNQALEIYTYNDYPLKWAGIQLNLGVVYRNRINGDKASNLEQGIDHLNQALKIYSHEDLPEDRAMVQNNLSSAFLFRIAGDRANNLEQAIYRAQRALEVYTREAYPEHWAKTQHNLASAFLFRITGQRNKNIEQAIIHCKQALSVFSKVAFPIEYASTHHNLAIAYFERLARDRADNLEQSLFHSNQALEIYTPQDFPHDWAMAQNNLGSAYYNRIMGKREDNLEKAILHYEQALAIHTRSSFPEHWAQIKNNLGEVYRNRLKGSPEDNFEKALHHLQEAEEVYTRPAFPERWAAIQTNLASVLLNRTRGGQSDNIDRGIVHLQYAMQIFSRQAFPERWAVIQINLGEAYHSHVRGERAANHKRAVKHYRQALEILQPTLFPNHFRRTARNLGNLYFDEQNWEEAYKAYSQAIKAGNVLLAGAYTEIGRQTEVGETSRLYSRAAYCLLKMKQSTQAFSILEQGKTRLLVEALALGDIDLIILPAEQQKALQVARETVSALEAEMRLPLDTPSRRSNAKLGRLLSQARQSLNHLISTIRQEQPDFMPTGLELPNLLALIPKDGALVAPLITSQGSAAFVLPHGLKTITEAHVIALDEFDDKVLQSLLIGAMPEPGWLTAYTRWRKGGSLKDWMTVIEKLTRRLWDTLLDPIDKQLQLLRLSKGTPILLMPQGGLGLLPLHAAWCEDNGTRRTFLDDYSVTYAPSGYVLQVGQHRLQDTNRQQFSLLAVINPTRDLRYSSIEGEQVVRLFDQDQTVILTENEATLEAVVRTVQGRNYLHFSCHGRYDWQETMRSGLFLAENKTEPSLTLLEIMSNLNLSTARLVTLSACETGLTEFQQTPDEYLGLPAGFLQAGASGVVSTLWAVDDLSTMLLMERFYQHHLQEKLPVAEALRQTQLWLRDVSAGELAARFAMERHKSTNEGAMSYDQASAAWRRFVRMESDKRPFTHPFYWAPFTFSGA